MSSTNESYTLQLPRQVDTAASLSIVQTLNQHADAKTIVLDFSNVSWLEPFGMLYIVSAIQHIRRVSPRLRVLAQGYQEKTYAIHMGFMQHCGISVGKKRRRASGSETYSPITEIKLSALQRRAFSRKLVVQDEVESAAQKLARLLIRDEKETNLFNVVQYAIRELGRNIVEHSDSPNLLYCAQFWPKKNRIEVCMVDDGVGLLSSLKGNPHISVSSDLDAIRAAILPGVSGKTVSAVTNYDDPWANSGFGLFMLSRLCAEGGSFFLASGSDGLMISKGAEQVVETDCSGTAVRLVLDTSRLSSLGESLKKFADEGSKVAKEITGSDAAGPSKASSMVRRAFHLN